MSNERNTTIDFLRGLAVILMIIIHVTAYFLHEPTTRFIWDYTHFAVPLFVFCSAYLYFERKKDAPFNLQYVYKRAKRLFIPYYIFLIFFFIFILFVKNQPVTVSVISEWVFLQGDRSLDWLVVLFLYLMILMPFIRFLQTKKFVFWIFVVISLASSVFLLFQKTPVHFRYSMALPWSLILIITTLFVQSKKQYIFLITTSIIALIIFIISRQLQINLGHNLVLTENKYPPNLYYLSYGIFWTFALYLFHKITAFDKWGLQPFFDFMSKYSYSIFFIHFLYLYLLREIVDIKIFGWIVVTIIITILSIVTQLSWNYFRSMLKKAN